MPGKAVKGDPASEDWNG